MQKKISQQYQKVQDFIKTQYKQIADKTLVIRSETHGLRVGELLVQNTGTCWRILNQSGIVINELRNRRLAVLQAALIHYKKYSQARQAANLDQKLDIYTADHQLFSHRHQCYPDNYVYKNRLSRIDYELDSVKNTINELEKSVSLQ
jgi:hypothetical protein